MTWVMKRERNPGHCVHGGARTMCGNSAVFYLGYGEVPCDKFYRIKRGKKNDSMSGMVVFVCFVRFLM